MKRSIFILILLGFIVTVPVNAQTGLGSSDIVISMNPENPAPNQTVLVSVQSYITDINSAKISWSVNGRVMKSGTGEKTFSFTTGSANTTTTLGISVITSDGETINKSIRLNPVYVDLIWESESYTPPFYKGKALFSYQNKITFIAIPHIRGSNGAEISPKNLIYKWKRNGTVVENASGYGRNTYLFIQTVIARPVEVSVEVTSPSINTFGTATSYVAPSDPFIEFYEKSPIYGIQFQKALSGTIQMKDTREITVTSIPYFFGTKDPSNELSYKWLINGSPIDNDLTQPTRIFRQVENTSGTANISVSIGHSDKILQLASKNFNLNFSAPATEQSSF